MITTFIIEQIEQIEGILILLGKQTDAVVLKAFEQLPEKEIIAYRDSLVKQFEVMNPGKTLLVVQFIGEEIPLFSLQITTLILTKTIYYGHRNYKQDCRITCQ